MHVKGERLSGRLAALARIGRDPRGGVSRPAYSEADRDARAAVMDWMRAASLEPTIDFGANIIGRRPGRDPSLPPLVFGSHVDSVPNGGDLDGPLGTLAAVEVAHTLAEQRSVLRHPIEVVVWSNEEGGLYGSRAVSGQLPAHELANASAAGGTIAGGIRFLGGDPDRLDEIRRAPGSIAGYLELHIEQGAVLERAGADIGVVEGIVGIAQWDVTVTGATNHAGTTPMDQRHDALLAAARFVDAVHRVVTSERGRQVGTVGRLEASPGAPNAIAGRAVCALELRDLDPERIDRLFDRIRHEAADIGAATGTAFDFAPIMRTTPAPSDPLLRRAIGEAAHALGLRPLEMPSGAGHDAQSMAVLGPSGMIFVPSVGGVSHSPEEYSRPESVLAGADVLLNAVLAADRLLDA